MLDTWTVAKTNKTNGNRKPVRSLVERTNDQTTVIWVGDVPIGGIETVVMAGPCSVETSEQVMSTAFAVKRSGARRGIVHAQGGVPRCACC